jgi:hypothetical protein
MIKKVYAIIKSFFIKEETFPCIVWDGKKMSYPSLTKTQIKEIETEPKYRAWIVTIDDERRKY